MAAPDEKPAAPDQLAPTLSDKTLLEIRRSRKVMPHEVTPLIDELLRWRMQWNGGALVRMEGDLIIGMSGDYKIEKIPMYVFKEGPRVISSDHMQQLPINGWTMYRWNAKDVLMKRLT